MRARLAVHPVNDAEVLADLDRHTRGYGTGVWMARQIGIDPAHLREMKSGRRSLNQKVAISLGWELRWVRKVRP